MIARASPKDRIDRTGDLAKVGEGGLVYFVGRADTQIKSRGYRVELGEVESAAHSLKTLKECAIVAIHTTGFEGDAICCAYVPAEGVEMTVAQLRSALGAGRADRERLRARARARRRHLAAPGGGHLGGGFPKRAS